MIRKIVIFGPQGSGKGTQGEMLAQRLGLMYVAAGNMYRQEIADQTKLGKKAEQHIQQGHLAPDALTNQMMQRRLKKKDMKKGFVLDGYPRNDVQQAALHEVTAVTDAVVINISDTEAVRRLAGRRSCVCGKTYHLTYNPPQFQDVCDACGKPLFIRPDDEPKAIQQRLAIYHRETEPLFETYRNQGILHEIDGEHSIDEVHRAVMAALNIAALLCP